MIIKNIKKLLGLNAKQQAPNIFEKGEIEVLNDFRVSMFRKAQNFHLAKVARMTIFNKVLNVGAAPDDKDKEGKKYQGYFKDTDFYSLDANQSEDNPKHLQVDLHTCGQLGHRFDLILLMSVLEHVINPFKVAQQLTQITASGGYLYLTLPFFYPIHKNVAGGYSDYWRFTDDAIPIIFEDFEVVWLEEIPSVIRQVNDRNQYWENDRTVAGYCVLLKKKN